MTLEDREFSAKWIWAKQDNYKEYNRVIIATKTFKLNKFESAVLRITADSFYRLYINNIWVNDGPAKSWPHYHQYDIIDVGDYLSNGWNEIKVIARYYGAGDFRGMWQQAGLLVQLDITDDQGFTCRIGTDETWSACHAKGWISNVPKISIQMEPFEYYDARLAKELSFQPAVVLFNANEGPWQRLHVRDVPLLTKEIFKPECFKGASSVKSNGYTFCISGARLLHPELIEANKNTSLHYCIATILKLDLCQTFSIKTEKMNYAIAGQHKESYTLQAGEYLVLAFPESLLLHEKEQIISFNGYGLKFKNPVNSLSDNPWVMVPFEEFRFTRDDYVNFYNITCKETHELEERFQDKMALILNKVYDSETFSAFLGNHARQIAYGNMFLQDPYWDFIHCTRQPCNPAVIDSPDAIINLTQNGTGVQISDNGCIELVYDFGTQRLGYYSFEIFSEAGVTVDVFGVEYIDDKGRIQHTIPNRNGMRYITNEGLNKFVSLKRRSGRYIFIKVMGSKKPVKINKFELIESLYPCNLQGTFKSSDYKINKLWDNSIHTLKLCIDDTFTDCPLYEQVFWVGDMRNEALFSYHTIGAKDIAARCLRLSSQSLDLSPMISSHAPTSWKSIIPAWSFLWHSALWEYYWFWGDVEFLRSMWPTCLKNLHAAERYLDGFGLFSASFWNFFDWSDIDSFHETVLYNSMFMVNAIDATVKCAKVLGVTDEQSWLSDLRHKLVNAINRYWDNAKKGYPDSIHSNGRVSESFSCHNNFLAFLFGIVEKENIESVVSSIGSCRDGVTEVGSPFAIMFLYEAMEKAGRVGDIIKSLYGKFIPMIDKGTTVWESFADGTTGSNGFPTRSHCHAWSAVALYYLPRLILGIRQTQSEGKSFEISPYLGRLKWAEGAYLTPQGLLHVNWKVKGDNLLEINYQAPKGVSVSIVKNITCSHMKVIVNSKEPTKQLDYIDNCTFQK